MKSWMNPAARSLTTTQKDVVDYARDFDVDGSGDGHSLSPCSEEFIGLRNAAHIFDDGN